MSSSQKLTREDFRREKLIEEQRKAGTIPAEVDPETGLDINPHIPSYISKAPWYVDKGHASLSHQRVNDETSASGSAGYDTNFYARGTRAGPAATKYRKGACENCGALTHKTRDCLERPRKVGAKWSGKDIQADEIITDVALGFDAKRDRWNGYDTSEHMKLVEEWELVDQARKKIREKQIQEKIAKGELDPIEIEDEEAVEEKYAESSDMPGQKVDTKSRTTVRNLRIREDTAKYLLNLDLNSAYYDPKTRSMRENPLRGTGKEGAEDILYTGDNFVRYSGDTTNMAKLQLFAWEAAERGKDVHLQSNPTQGELLYKEFLKKKDTVSSSVKESILQRYGGEEHLAAPPKELLLAQTEQYVEYNPMGRVIKGQEKAKMKSKYEEDVYLNNHTSVWGSFWKDFKWGYACCHSFTKNSYCTGEAGKEAARASEQLLLSSKSKSNTKQDTDGDEEITKDKTLLQQHIDSVSKGTSKSETLPPSSSKRLGEGDIELDKQKLAEHLEKERERIRDLEKKSKRRREDGDEVVEEEPEFDFQKDGKRQKKYGESESFDVSQEELEAYRLLRTRVEDPMANYVDEDGAEEDDKERKKEKKKDKKRK